MGLDTRGFMDGALRGFQAAEGYYQRQKDNERRDKLDQRRDELDQREEQRYQDEKTYNRERNAQADKRADERLTLQKQEAKQQGTLRDAQIETQKSNKALHDYELSQKKKVAYLQENLPIIQSALKRYMETGELDPMFDHEYLKGSAYDPRRYTPRVVQAAFDVKAAIDSENISYKDPVFTRSLGVLYERNIKQGIGEIDPETGKKIKDKEYARHDLVADIDPNREGDQPGLVIGLKVTYEDGSSKIAPVTEGRGAGTDQSVMVIPVDKMTRDVRSQIELANQFFTSDHYANLFNSGSEKSKDEMNKEWRKAVITIEQDRTEALNELLDPSPEQIEALNTRFDNRRAIVDQVYGRAGKSSGPSDNAMLAVNQWIGSDPQKQQFIAELAQTMDLSQISVEALEHNYQRLLKVKQDEQGEQQKQAQLAQLRQQKVERSNANTVIYTPSEVSGSTENVDQRSQPVSNLTELIYSNNANDLEEMAKEKYNSYPSNFDRLRDFPIP